MSKHSLPRFVAIVLVILALVIMVGGVISALLLGQRGFGTGWSEGWTGWFTLPVIGLSCAAGFGLLMLGAILLLMVDISRNLDSTKVVVQKPTVVQALPPAVVVETPAAPAVAAVEAAGPAAGAATLAAVGAVAAATTGEESPAAEMRLPGSEDAARVSAELAAQKAEEQQPSKRERKPAKLNMKVAYVGAISEEEAARLNAIGVRTTGDLLARGATRKGRQEIADQTGIDVKVILTWVNHADLFRLRGVGEEFAQLLEASGVDTVMELAQRNAANLQARMAEVNAERQLVRQVPVQSQIERWIVEAKTLPRMVIY